MLDWIEDKYYLADYIEYEIKKRGGICIFENIDEFRGFRCPLLRCIVGDREALISVHESSHMSIIWVGVNNKDWEELEKTERSFIAVLNKVLRSFVLVPFDKAREYSNMPNQWQHAFNIWRVRGGYRLGRKRGLELLVNDLSPLLEALGLR
ncbi:MAG: hypothetical protein QXT26_02440 [Thermoproteota archaeon]